MTEEFRYDVFISYSHADEDWVVKTLLPRLEAAGLKVCIDYRDFDAGKPSIINMEDAVDQSRYTLLVLTPNWTGSDWTGFESVLVQTDDPLGRRQKMIPLMLEKCELPKRIKTLTYVDFTRPDRAEIAWTQLLTALGKPPEAPTPDAPTSPTWFLKHPYGMPPNFTGRVDERAALTQWLDNDRAHPLRMLRALGGFGKSALAWHWITHDLDARCWPRLVWWGFYDERDFTTFLGETLEYLRVDVGRLSVSQQVDALLQLLRQPGTLLILDGFERALRAYGSMSAAYQDDDSPLPMGAGQGEGKYQSGRDCISPHAEAFLMGLSAWPGLQSKVLLTTRLRPRILETRYGERLQGCDEDELTQMQPADAVAFFRAQGIRGSRAEIERICAPYGYHPLSLRLLAGMIANDLLRPGDITIAQGLDISGDLIQRKTHVLATAYDSLPENERLLLSRLACFRGAVEYAAIAALADGSGDANETKRALQHLLARGLIHRSGTTATDHSTFNLQPSTFFDLHPIVRRYAYAHLGTEARAATHGQLVIYFVAVEAPPKIEKLEDLNPVIELYHHTIRAGRYDDARTLFRDRLDKPTYFQFGAYQLQVELLRALFPDGEDKLPRLKSEAEQASALNDLALVYSLSGQPRRAVPLLEMHNDIYEKAGHKKNLAIGLGNLAQMAQLPIGALREAETNLRRRIDLCRAIEDEFREAVGHQELGRTLAYCGRWDQAGQELDTAMAMFEKQNNVQGQGIAAAYRALRALLMLRERPPSAYAHSPRNRGEMSSQETVGGTINFARRALELADEDARTDYPVERDFIHAHWLLGASYRANNDTSTS